MFKYPTYGLHFTDMHTNCEKCGLQFEIEPGFFWGSMYISYALTIALSVILGIIIYIVSQSSNVWLYVGVISGFLVLLSPYNFRLSRAILLHAFSQVRYDPNFLKNEKGGK